MASPATMKVRPALPRRGCASRFTPQQARAVTLVRGDARELLPRLPDECADLIVTDPPYEFARGRTYFKTWFDDLPDEAWAEIFGELFRVLHRNSHMYVCSNARMKAIFDAAAAGAGFKVRVPLIWDKVVVGLGRTWRSQYEFVCFYSKGARAGNRRDRGNVIQAPRVRGGYPTEKPVGLLRQLIEQSSAPGELVLDPFAGSGSTGQAAAELGRQALLCDVAPEFAERRLGRSPRSIESAVAALKRRQRG